MVGKRILTDPNRFFLPPPESLNVRCCIGENMVFISKQSSDHVNRNVIQIITFVRKVTSNTNISALCCVINDFQRWIVS